MVLPPEIARQIHPDWWKNEQEYWAHRESLLSQYANLWVAFAQGTVIASGRSPVNVFHEAKESGQHPYVACVGREYEPARIRRTTFRYDDTYPGEALPLVSVEFRTDSIRPGTVVERVIPDTGADATVLPWSDCERLQFDTSNSFPSSVGGVGQSTTATVVFSVWVYLDSTAYRCQVHADFNGTDRILGRDVLNRMDVLFRGESREVVLNP